MQVSNWSHHKSQVRSRNGMVVARHPLSAEAGLRILQAGGNAVDAAIAASLAGSVVQQAANSIGGGGMLLVSHPTRGRSAINYLYQAPAAATADMFPLEPHAAPGLFGWNGIKNQLNEIGGLAVGVPGSIAGLHSASTRFGKLSWAQVVAPAATLARDGYAMDWYGTLMLSVHADQMQAFPLTANQFLRQGTYAYRPAVIDKADVFQQPALAQTLDAIGRQGPSAFYSGRVAASLVQAVRASGGVMGEADLEGYEVRQGTPSTVRYRDHAVDYVPYGVPTLAMFLGILGHFDMAALDTLDPNRLHLIMEALRRCWHYRDAFNGDSAKVSGPWAGLANADFAKAVAATIDPLRVRPVDPSIDPYRFDAPAPDPKATTGTPGRHEGTVHISAVDADGCMVALTETVVGNFGSLVTSDTGVLLNNGMIGFSPIQGQKNSVGPGKRPTSNMSPVIVSTPDGRPFATLGASGGRKIIPAVAQILNLLIDHRLEMQDAVAHPRLDFEGEKVILDFRFGPEVARRLQAMGHRVEVREEGLSTFEFGNACGIRADAEGFLTSGVNPFQMTSATGY